jgi:formate hydrogenlyase subunit 3/multisubunit Na+/H+ antiporter MnhD subunit
MNVNYLLILIFIIMIIALISTFMVGFSRENKEENPEYEKKTGAKWARLTTIYIATIAIVVVAFFMLKK